MPNISLNVLTRHQLIELVRLRKPNMYSLATVMVEESLIALLNSEYYITDLEYRRIAEVEEKHKDG